MKGCDWMGGFGFLDSSLVSGSVVRWVGVCFWGFGLDLDRGFGSMTGDLTCFDDGSDDLTRRDET